MDLNGGFCEFVSVNESMCYKMPEGSNPKHAALVEILGIGFHACNRAKVKQGDTILIWGAGKVGQCILQAALTRSVKKIIMVDILDERLRMAKNAFPEIHTVNATQGNPREAIMSITKHGVDVAFEAVGHAKAIEGAENPARGCINSIVGGGTVCVLGLADQEFPIVFKELIWKEGSIIASRVSHGEFAEVINHIAEGKLNPDALVSSVFPMEQAQKAFQKLELQPEQELKILLENS
ncbi:zinc-binding dehydrogenase [Bacteroidota bacterium]